MICDQCKFDKEKDCLWFCRILLEYQFQNMANELNISIGDIYHCLRVACTGKKGSPPIYDVLNLLGKEKVIKRIQQSIEKLERN